LAGRNGRGGEVVDQGFRTEKRFGTVVSPDFGVRAGGTVAVCGRDGNKLLKYAFFLSFDFNKQSLSREGRLQIQVNLGSDVAALVVVRLISRY
jgi:hypothetical protein